MDKSKVAILTTVANFELYQRTSQYFPSGIKKYVFDGTNGMHGIHSIKYMMKKLKDKGIEWLIMADEDVIFINGETVYSIIEKMIETDSVLCGVRDGGMISHRNKNPYVINTFFSILNFEKIVSNWKENEVLKNQLIFENEFNDNISNLSFNYDLNSLYEPYYCFYFWLRRKFKNVLFLDAEMCEDEISNSVLFNNQIFLYHTWYARSYGINEKHTLRINKLINGLKLSKSECDLNDIVIYKKKTFAQVRFIKKYIKKIYQKLTR